MKHSSIKTSDISIARVREFFLEEIRKGNAPSVDVFAKAFPHLADDIRTELPAIAMLEHAVGKEKKKINSLVSDKMELGGCIIEEEIGRGAMGIVYRAHQTELDRRVAVKVLMLHGADSAAIAQRFELERRAMARLEHPNIVPVYSYGFNDKFAYLIMKCIDGHSLHDLQEGLGNYRTKVMFASLRSDWSAIAKLGLDVASGLHHSHEKGLIHRDIKPGNLLIDATGKVWITDYGLAKIHDYARSLSQTGDMIGTPRYMAPEQIRGICDLRSDIYSLGITLYELVTNEKPWGEANLTSLISQRATLELVDVRKKNPAVPESLAKIIMKACSFSPEDRYQNCKEMCVVLDRFLSGITPSDRRKRRREPDDIFRRKTQRNIAFASVGTVIAFVGISYALSVARSMKQPTQEPTVVYVPKARLTSTNLIEKLAEGKEEDVGKVVHEFFRQSIRDAGDEFHLADQEKSEILNQWDSVTDKIKKRGMDESSMKKFIDGYKETTIPIGTKAVSMVRLVERSGFSHQEQQAAFQLLRDFAKAVIHRSIPENEAISILSHIGHGRVLSTEELNSVQIHDNDLRNWLGMVQSRMQYVPVSAIRELNVSGELERTLQNAMDGSQR